jgi:hypothetical protein
MKAEEETPGGFFHLHPSAFILPSMAIDGPLAACILFSARPRPGQAGPVV